MFTQKKEKISGVPKRDRRGKYSCRNIPVENKNEVKNHIKSFSAVESHYFRAKTSKKYLDSNHKNV